MTYATTTDVLRPLPHALGQEKSVLSTMLQDPTEFIPIAVEEQLTERHFYMPSHSLLFGAMLEEFAAGREIELVSLVQKLLDTGRLDGVGGASGITDLYTYAPSPVRFKRHIGELRLKLAAREMLRVSNETVAGVYDSPDEVPETLEKMERMVDDIRDCLDASMEIQTLKSSVEKFLADLESAINGKGELPGLTTGFDQLDRQMNGGMKAGDMFVVAARPSMGKTAFLMNVAEHVCMELKKPSLIFSVEMSQDQLVSRLISSRSKFAMSQLSRGITPTKGDLQRIQRVALEVAEAKTRLFVDQREGITIDQLRAKARRMKRDHGIQFIGIDYLQLLRSNSKQAIGSREREIADISAGIKGLAKELGIPVMILAQLNRGPESRGGKTVGVPRMSDLRESGSIEQDADMVGLLYRTAYYAEDAEQKAADDGVARLDLAKNRNGATGPIPLTFIADLMRFESGQPYQGNDESDDGRFDR